MLGELYTYLWLLFEKYQAIAGVVLPSALIGGVLIMLERVKRFSGPYWDLLFRLGKVAIVVIAVFWIGFLAWRDEHQTRLDTDAKYNDLVSKGGLALRPSSRLQIGDIEPIASDGLYTYQVNITNAGAIPAYLVSGRLLLRISSHGPVEDSDSQRMRDIEKDAMEESRQAINSTEITPNHYIGMAITAVTDENKPANSLDYYNGPTSGSMYLYVLVVIYYKDDSLLSSEQRRVTRYCASYSKSFNKFVQCPNQNRNYITSAGAK
ncbi:hypothetical protein [Methylobacterium sp. Leaf94]|uniref:hypothetical protein n=1 Tax=Methylobacterium sp. Leaf94 TaxID=1736250 RepID=UPI000B23E4A9|nr:hypothetical protein [Methylobacterium sp. Leaf94]